MPTVLRFLGFRVAIYLNDHRPAHVHVIGADREAVFELQCPDGPPKLRESFGFHHHQLSFVKARLADSVAKLSEDWERIHGDY